MNWNVVWDNAPLFLEGLWMTVQLSAVAAVLSLVGGMLVALLRISKIAPLRWIAGAYINVLRAIPPFVLIIYIYYGVAQVAQINFNPFQAGVIALTLQYSAWIAEVYRAGIQAVPTGQTEAAHSLGFNGPKTFLTIVLPQALRIVIPPLGNNIVGIVKDSSLVSYIGVMELLRTSQLLTSTTFRAFEIYTAALVLYLVLTVAISALFGWLEKRNSLGRNRVRHVTKSRAARLTELQNLARTSA
jgi:arginine/lysine/histidine/glutamine transport system substrate-binding/permease protein